MSNADTTGAARRSGSVQNAGGDSYSAFDKLLHWLMAIMIIGVWIVGTIMTDMPKGPDKFALYGNHKAVGVLVLVLAVIRIVWRHQRPAPALPRSIPDLQRVAARVGHILLYVLMLAMPISGMVMSGAGGHPVDLFGLVTFTPPVPESKALAGFAHQTHGALAWLLAIVVALHFLAALHHHFIAKDGVLRRMLPGS